MAPVQPQAHGDPTQQDAQVQVERIAGHGDGRHLPGGQAVAGIAARQDVEAGVGQVL
ncbi:hypothetical protein FC419_12940 [Bordetella pertussis]